MKSNSTILRLSTLILVGFLCGCMQQDPSLSTESGSSSVNEESFDPFAEHNTDAQNTDDIRFSWGFVQPTKQLQFAAEMPLDLFIENSAENPADFGILLFVDGMLQADSTTDSALLCTAHLNGLERKEYYPDVRPVLDGGLSGHSLQMGLVYDPGFLPETPQTVYGHHHRITGISVPIYNAEKSVTEKTKHPQIQSRPMTNEENQKYQMPSDSGELHLEKKKSEDDPAPNSFTSNDKMTAVLLGGNKGGRWRISMLCSNHLAAAFEGQNYLDIDMKAGEIASYECDVSSIVQKGNHPVYLIAVPLENEYGALIQSHVMTFVGRES